MGAGTLKLGVSVSLCSQMPHLRDADSPQQERNSKYRNWDFEKDEEPEVFKDILQRDPAVCDHCFTLRYEHEYHEWWRGSFGWSPFEQLVPVPGENEPVPADDTSQGMRLACSNCGHRKTKHRPLGKDQIPEIIENIAETLEAKGIPFDSDKLRHEVNRRNTSRNQGRQDSHVFAPAVREAVESVGTFNISEDERIVYRNR